MICFMLTNSDKCLGPLFRWWSTTRSNAAGRGRKSHTCESTKKNKRIRIRGRTQGQKDSGEGQRWTSSCIIGTDLNMPPPKSPKDAPNLNLSPQIPPPTSFVLIYRAQTHGCARAGTHTWICGAPHSSALLEIKRDPRQQPCPLQLQ